MWNRIALKFVCQASNLIERSSLALWRNQSSTSSIALKTTKVCFMIRNEKHGPIDSLRGHTRLAGVGKKERKRGRVYARERESTRVRARRPIHPHERTCCSSVARFNVAKVKPVHALIDYSGGHTGAGGGARAILRDPFHHLLECLRVSVFLFLTTIQLFNKKKQSFSPLVKCTHPKMDGILWLSSQLLTEGCFLNFEGMRGEGVEVYVSTPGPDLCDPMIAKWNR